MGKGQMANHICPGLEGGQPTECGAVFRCFVTFHRCQQVWQVFKTTVEFHSSLLARAMRRVAEVGAVEGRCDGEDVSNSAQTNSVSSNNHFQPKDHKQADLVKGDGSFTMGTLWSCRSTTHSDRQHKIRSGRCQSGKSPSAQAP